MKKNIIIISLIFFSSLIFAEESIYQAQEQLKLLIEAEEEKKDNLEKDVEEIEDTIEILETEIADKTQELIILENTASGLENETVKKIIKEDITKFEKDIKELKEKLKIEEKNLTEVAGADKESKLKIIEKDIESLEKQLEEVEDIIYKKNHKTFIQVNIGKIEFYTNYLTNTARQSAGAISLNGGVLRKSTENAGYKWYGGLEYSNNDIFKNTMGLVGFSGVFFLENPKVSFNMGPVLAANRYYDAQNIPTKAISLGADFSFSFVVTQDFGMELGYRYLLFLENFSNQAYYNQAGENLYLGFTYYF